MTGRLPSREGSGRCLPRPKQSDVPLDLSAIEYRKLALSGKQSVQFRWWKQLPIQVRAMVKTEDVLFVAGPHGSPLTSQAALEGKAAASLLAVSPADGRVLAEMTLPSTPVWDGMAAAEGNLYLALANGQVLCLWSVGLGPAGHSVVAGGLACGAAAGQDRRGAGVGRALAFR